MKIIFVIAATLLLLLSFGFEYWGHHFGIGVNLSPSAPEGIYRYFPYRALHRGDWVDFSPKNIPAALSRSYVHRGEKLIKQIMGMPGDVLLSKEQAIFLRYKDEKHWIYLGSCLPKDRKGRLMHCQQWSHYSIPPETYYMGSRRTPFSFDSRYFGLVKKNHVQHVLRLLYSFQ